MEGSRCDFIIFFLDAGERHVVTVPLGIKSGWAYPEPVFKQLQGGADFADRFAPCNAVCRPILLSGKGINQGALNRVKVQFRGRQMTIGPARCNRARNLERALASAVTGD